VKRLLLLLFLVIPIASLFSFNCALMITGEIGGNPIYEMMAKGAKEAAEEGDFNLKIVEGGYNPAKWEPTLISLAATGQYDVVVTFTEGMPESVEKAADMFPNQKFILIDGIAGKRENVFSLGFHDEQMAYLAGAFGALITRGELAHANDAKKIALVAGDIYPAMTDRMKPAYEKAARDLDPETEVLFTVAGSWSDPTKGRDIAAALFSQGVDVIYSIAGGTSVGVINEAKKQGKYCIGVDSNIISFAPDTILACTLKNADMTIKQVLLKASNGTLEYGKAERWGVTEEAIGFTFDDPNYKQNVPSAIQERMREIFEQIKNGTIKIL